MTPEDHTAPPPPDSDVMLVQRTLAGESRAFDLLVIKYQRRVERLIGRMVRDTDLVQDIAQETFIRAYRALAQFRGDAQFYTWLYRIAVNSLVGLKTTRMPPKPPDFGVIFSRLPFWPRPRGKAG